MWDISSCCVLGCVVLTVFLNHASSAGANSSRKSIFTSQQNANWVPALCDPLTDYTVAAPLICQVRFTSLLIVDLHYLSAENKKGRFVTLEFCTVNEFHFRLLYGRDQKHVTSVILVRPQLTSRKLRKRFGCYTFMWW
jgi:hypothetical protein